MRGYRIELAEIDTALTSHPDIEEASAYVIQQPDGSDQLIAAVILRAGSAVPEQELIAYVRGKLPAYAVPEAIRPLETFPRTGTGKIDRKALQQTAQSLLTTIPSS